MSPFALSSIITSVLSFLLGFFVLFQGLRIKLNQSWFLVSVLMGSWSLGLWGVVSSDNYANAFIFQQLLDISAIFIPIAYFRFAIELIKVRERQLIQLACFVGVAIILVLISPLPVFKEGLVSLPEYGFNYWIKPGVLYYLFPAYFSGVMFYSFYLIVSRIKAMTNVEKNQTRYILFAGLVGYLGGATNFFPQIIKIYPIGNYFVILYIVAVAYAILRYRLMGIRLIASRIYIYSSIAIFAFLFFHLMIYANNRYLGGVYSFESLSFQPLLALLFAVIFVPLLNKIQSSSDVLFYRGQNPKKIFKDLAIKMSSSLNLDELLSILTDAFRRVLATENIDVFVFKKNEVKGNVCMSILRNKTKSVKLGARVCDSVLQERIVLVRDELEHHGRATLVKELDEAKAKVIAPLVLRDEVVGMILLGEKIEGGSYNQEDIEFIEVISSQAAVAIENARLYAEVDEFNSTLQQKVDAQTRDITEQAEHLKKLMAMRSEFLDITSHQLRTPVSVIKGVLSMLEEGSIPPDRVKAFIRGAMEKSIKLGEIISDILRASEMDSDKFTMTVRPVDLNEMMEKIEDDKRRTIDENKVKMIFNIPTLPPVMTDPKYVEHAIVNLINNAQQYTVEGSITVSAEVTGSHVIMRVADTGIGIPPEARAKLFTKFARAQNAVTTFTDGTGLGLFIIKQIVDANPGAKIEIEKTEVNKGTTFALWLPIANKV